MGINKKIKKYYIKRFFLFEEFDNGIQMDEESWYSVVAEPISLNIKERLLLSKIPLNTIFEPFSGVGGVAVHLSCLAKRYVLNDLDPNKLEMLKNNMAVYGVDQSNVEFLNKDFLVIEPFKADLVILCPPWGGINLD
jgi:trimethylguanosine synthase